MKGSKRNRRGRRWLRDSIKQGRNYRYKYYLDKGEILSKRYR